MSVLVSDMVTRCRRLLNDNPFTDLTQSAITSSTQTTFDVTDGTLYDEGIILEFPDGEQMFVQSIATNTLTVVRGWNDTDASTYALHTLIQREPVFQYVQITEALQDAIRSELWPYVWKQITNDDGGNITVTPHTNSRWYEVDERCLGLSQVVQLIGSTNPYPFFYGTHQKTYPVALRRHMPTSLIASGVAVYIPYVRDANNDIDIVAIGKITATVEDDSGDSYIDLDEGSLAEAVVDFAVSRLLAGSDITRTTQEDTNLGDQTVTPGRRTNLASYWHAEGLRKRRDYEAELRDNLPKMEPGPMGWQNESFTRLRRA